MDGKGKRPGGGASRPQVPGRRIGRRGDAAPGAADAAADADAARSKRTATVALRTAHGRSTAQQRWLARQLNDPYVAAARAQGWRSRAAFKLIELDDRFRLLRPGLRVLDLGAAPGGWCQVAVKRGAARVVGVDLLPVEPIRGAALVEGDLEDPAVSERLRLLLGGAPDLVLSDMAPNTTGHAATDHLRVIGLAEAALDLALELLADGGAFVAKVFQGGSEKDMLSPMKQAFNSVKHAKPPASRKESSELYVVATGYRRERGLAIRAERRPASGQSG